MVNHATQEERLDYLIEAFKAESDEYNNLQIPVDIDGKKRILRSLMNIRMPKEVSDIVLKVQNAYLKERAKENKTVFFL